MGENCHCSILLVFREDLQQNFREVYLQQKIIRRVGKAAGCICKTVTVGNIGFDVKNRGAVHKICACDVEDSAVFLGVLHTHELHA